MTKEIKIFLEKIVNNEELDQDFRLEAKYHLHQNFKEEIINKFEYFLNSSYNERKDLKQFIRKRNKVKVIDELAYYDNLIPFFNENWERMGLILDILNEYLDELEKEKEKENE